MKHITIHSYTHYHDILIERIIFSLVPQSDLRVLRCTADESSPRSWAPQNHPRDIYCDQILTTKRCSDYSGFTNTYSGLYHAFFGFNGI